MKSYEVTIFGVVVLALIGIAVCLIGLVAFMVRG